MIGSNRAMPVGAALAFAALVLNAPTTLAEDAALKLRAVPVGDASALPSLSIELFRWSTDAERAPVLAALSAPPPAPPAAPPADASAAGQAGRGGRGGRAGGGRAGGGRGGRGGGAAASPLARLTATIRSAPTLGFIWGDVTGYSIKYAWRGVSGAGAAERIVLVTDRRFGVPAPEPAPPASSPSDAEFTVIEIRLDGKGAGEGKMSLATGVVVDAAAQTVALDGYAAAPALLKVTR